MCFDVSPSCGHEKRESASGGSSRKNCLMAMFGYLDVVSVFSYREDFMVSRAFVSCLAIPLYGCFTGGLLDWLY
ncbi:hypothetical protein V6N12_037763 [Hibiscus sabdariffa]|uniref:Uncharacterized protein n=1 Tax=Hibiscus sabdariffa TaxID=183260 RepID=A0ABR2B1D5_9ROSI